MRVPFLFLVMGLVSCASVPSESRKSLFGSLNSSIQIPVSNQSNQLNYKSTNVIENKMDSYFQKVAQGVWRTPLPASEVFQVCAKLLSTHYILERADDEKFLLTQWDKFYIQGRLFRNKMSVSIFPINVRETEIVVKNNVEYHAPEMMAKSVSEEYQWLPTQDITDEIKRFVDGLNEQVRRSVALHQRRF